MGSEVTVETSLKYLIGDGDLRNNYWFVTGKEVSDRIGCIFYVTISIPFRIHTIYHVILLKCFIQRVNVAKFKYIY